MIHITETITIPDRDITERFVRAGGSGGQNIRKEATAVELRLDIGRSSLPADVKTRLIALAGRRATNDGVLVIVSRALRSQPANRAAAHARLLALLARAAALPAARKATKPRRAVRTARRVSKELQSVLKRSRSRRVDA